MSEKINKKEVTTKKATSKTTKKGGAKMAKKSTTNFRKTLVNPILTKNKGLTLVENAHGAIQVKREGSLLFNFRKDGKTLITHPMFDKKGRGRKRIFKVPGTKYDHFSLLPSTDVTLAMLQARVNDKKTSKEYHQEFYGKRMSESGIFMKMEAAKKRAEKLKKEANKSKKGAKTSKRVAKKTVKKAIKKVPKSKKVSSAITRVAAKAVS